MSKCELIQLIHWAAAARDKLLQPVSARMDKRGLSAWNFIIAPLIISVTNGREVLYRSNRRRNVSSHKRFVPWIDRAIELVGSDARQITLGGDTDLTLSAELDRWDSQCIKFIVGTDANRKITSPF